VGSYCCARTEYETLHQQAKKARGRAINNFVGASNSGFRLLDACFDDVAYARYLLNSRLPKDRNIRNKVNWKDQQSGVSILHCLAYSDLSKPLKLLLENKADANARNQVNKLPSSFLCNVNNTYLIFTFVNRTRKLHFIGVLR
jgi:hypothetical protein